MNEWIDELSDLTAAGERVVVVTVAGIRGSAPREVGAKMLVTRTQTFGTIGGGQLEYQCTRIASEALGDGQIPTMCKFPLGASMGQCCGGVVDILFEPIVSSVPIWLQELRALYGQRVPAVVCTFLGDEHRKCVVTAESALGDADELNNLRLLDRARDTLESGRVAHRRGDWFFDLIVGSDLNIAVFGAGHVGSAVVQALSMLDCNIRWFDSRRNIFHDSPANVRCIESAAPSIEVAAMPAQSCYLVMTHSHALDFEICDRILQRGDAAYCGLIGSQSKRRRFEKRFRDQGLPQQTIDRLICPIGVEGIRGKKPAEIALASSAELLQAYEQMRHRTDIEYPDNVHPLKHKK